MKFIQIQDAIFNLNHIRRVCLDTGILYNGIPQSQAYHRLSRQDYHALLEYLEQNKLLDKIGCCDCRQS